MWQRYSHTHKLMPAGIVAATRCVRAVWAISIRACALARLQSSRVTPRTPALLPHPPLASAVMAAFYLWNMLLFAPPASLGAKQH